MAKAKIQISKYPNRRYYDRSRSKHITLEQIRDLIRDGNEIEITDSKTGENLTRRVMTQILLEFESEKLSLFPLPMLQLMIRTNESWIRQFLEFQLNNTVSNFQRIQEQFSTASNPFSGISPNSGNPFAAFSETVGNPFQSFFQESGSGSADEIAELKAEIERLKAKMAEES